MRTIPDKMRTDEVYPVAFGSLIFINIGLHASNFTPVKRAAGDSSAAAEELRARGQRLKDMNIYSHEYAVYAYDSG